MVVDSMRQLSFTIFVNSLISSIRELATLICFSYHNYYEKSNKSKYSCKKNYNNNLIDWLKQPSIFNNNTSGQALMKCVCVCVCVCGH